MLSPDDIKKIEQYDIQAKVDTPALAAATMGTLSAIGAGVMGGLAWNTTSHPLFLIAGMSAVAGAVFGYSAYMDKKEQIAKENEIFSALTPEQVNERKIALMDLQNNHITPNAQKILDERKVEEYDATLKNAAIEKGLAVGVGGALAGAVAGFVTALPTAPNHLAFIIAGAATVTGALAATIGYHMEKKAVNNELQENSSLSPDALKQKKIDVVNRIRAAHNKAQKDPYNNGLLTSVATVKMLS